MSLGAKAEQRALATRLRADGLSWAQVAVELRTRWGLNARQVLRIARGLSQPQVAAEWTRRWPDDPKTDKNVSTWECWPASGHMPSLVVLDRLARIYRCSVADLVADFDDYGVDTGGRTLDDLGSMDRRTLIAGLGGSLASFALAPTGLSRGVGRETVDYFSAQLSAHWQTDRDLGPHMLASTAVAECRSVLQAIEVARGGLRNDLLHLATAFSGFVAWLHQDIGDLGVCSRWLDMTVELAHKAGDPQLLAYGLTCKAMLRADLDDGVGAVELAKAAMTNAYGLCAKAKVMAMQQAAIGHALLGERTQVDRLMDELAEVLEDASTNEAWGGDRLRRTATHVVDAQRATCYGRLGLADEAAELWANLPVHESTERRDRGVYLARHATALLDVGEPRQAARLAAEGIDDLHRTGSARMRREFGRLHDKAIPWTGTTSGRDLGDVLDSITN
jgi:hypothetical protein